MYLDLRVLAMEKSILSLEYGECVEDGVVVFPEGASDGLNSCLERLEKLIELESQLFNDDMLEYSENESTLIPEDEFSKYCENYAYDIGAVKRESEITMHIMWDSWEQSLRSGFNEVTFDDEKYLLQSY